MGNGSIDLRVVFHILSANDARSRQLVFGILYNITVSIVVDALDNSRKDPDLTFIDGDSE